jgi:16S rRNA (guanine527-N7)-methyltransferase
MEAVPLTQLQAFCQRQGFPLEPDQVERFGAYRERLYELNRVMNLTRVPYDECELRHFIDSLLPASWIPQGAKVLELGTGPGLPAWPLACARPDLLVTAVDSSGKMLTLPRKLPLDNLTILEKRAESLDLANEFDWVTGRAVAPLPAQLEISVRPCCPGGRIVPFRTLKDEKTLSSIAEDTLGIKLVETRQAALPGTDIVRFFPFYEKVARTPKELPRPWGQIKNKPLTRRGSSG